MIKQGAENVLLICRYAIYVVLNQTMIFLN